jgi:hypothetical protein
MDAYHHHRAGPDGPVVVLVPVPVPFEVGSPKAARAVKPGQYPRQDRQHWRPATAPPSFLQRMAQQEQDVRAFLDAARRQTAGVST